MKPIPPCTWSAPAITRFDASPSPGLRGRRRDRLVGVVGAEAPRGPVRRGAHALDVDEHVGAPVLHRLERADRPAELHPVLRVLDRHRRAPRRRAAEQLERRAAVAPRSSSDVGERRRRRAGGAGVPSSSSQPSGRVRSMAGSAGGRPSASRSTTNTRRAVGVGRRPRARASATGRERRPDPGGPASTPARRRPLGVDRVGAATPRDARRCASPPSEPLDERRRRRAGRATLDREHGRQERRRRDVAADLLEQHRRARPAPSPRPPSASGTATPSQPCSTIARPEVAVPAARPSRRPRGPASVGARSSRSSRAPSRSAGWSSERSKSIGGGRYLTVSRRAPVAPTPRASVDSATTTR